MKSPRKKCKLPAFQKEEATGPVKRDTKPGEKLVSQQAAFTGKHLLPVQSGFDLCQRPVSQLHILENGACGTTRESDRSAGSFLLSGPMGDPLQCGIAAGVHPHPLWAVFRNRNWNAERSVACPHGQCGASEIRLHAAQNPHALCLVVDLDDAPLKKSAPSKPSIC